MSYDGFIFFLVLAVTGIRLTESGPIKARAPGLLINQQKAF